ncbi:Predicted ABC-type ATPase [Algoriphagus locisalis]|uniref:Predicted ABC-type ATPase n=1 Tax=Algoriphagus locisalis TaxID=305507 RepID=A0A1I6XTE9_9BACT|nr:hypothetical protein [Algoriphagus locisalis]SFT41417.1 Predicted ABC-type ATPase [Algoriphagus locisalis]
MSSTTKFRLFAGPNGSGKSTLISEIKQSFNFGVFINADLIEYELDKKKYIELTSIFGNNSLKESDWKDFFDNYKDEDSRAIQLNPGIVAIQEGVLICRTKIDSYVASIIASFFRYELVKKGTSFSFETVMSHSTKVDFLKKLKLAGYKTYLYFICTDDPKINVQRVVNRKAMGGHDVPHHLIESRYFRSLEQLHSAFMIADRAFVIDSSNRNRNLILEKSGQRVTVHSETIPGWVDEYLLSKLELE